MEILEIIHERDKRGKESDNLQNFNVPVASTLDKA